MPKILVNRKRFKHRLKEAMFISSSNNCVIKIINDIPTYRFKSNVCIQTNILDRWAKPALPHEHTLCMLFYKLI